MQRSWPDFKKCIDLVLDAQLKPNHQPNQVYLSIDPIDYMQINQAALKRPVS